MQNAAKVQKRHDIGGGRGRKMAKTFDVIYGRPRLLQPLGAIRRVHERRTPFT